MLYNQINSHMPGIGCIMWINGITEPTPKTPWAIAKASVLSLQCDLKKKKALLLKMHLFLSSDTEKSSW